MRISVRQLAHQLVGANNRLAAANSQFAANEQYHGSIINQQKAFIQQQNTTIQQQNATIEDLRKQVADPFRLALPLLHPRILNRCRAPFESGQFEDVIFNATKTIEDEIRRLIGADETSIGVNLVSDAFARKPSPPLLLSSIPAEQEGAHMLFRGVIGLLKNPRSHRYLDTEDRTAAFEAMAFASSLLRMLDSAKVSPSVVPVPAPSTGTSTGHGP